MLKKGEKILVFKENNQWSVNAEILNIVFTEDILYKTRSSIVTYKEYSIYINHWSFMQDKENVYAKINGNIYEATINVNLHECFLKIITK